jgi:orotidine-5'-phosphate decarboxylase
VQNTIVTFNRAIIEGTHDLVCAYKLNSAFYEAHGSEGLAALRLTILHIHRIVPDVPVILDAKRADIGNTNKGYVSMAFDYLGADAITVHPYLGEDALRPFLDCADKGIIVLCRTTNLGAGEFQDLHTLTIDPREKPEGMTSDEWLEILCEDSLRLYERVALNVATKWNTSGNCHLVVGATYPAEAQVVRRLVGDVPFLIPGIGTQGGDVEATVLASTDSRSWGMIINASRSIIFASNGVDFAEAARRETEKLRDLINQYR